ncbi:MAG: hypothetical protein K8R23_15230 [Chthoniobacter sp.]|nr:hypothetical protein [Chthoniobacter sp.]
MRAKLIHRPLPCPRDHFRIVRREMNPSEGKIDQRLFRRRIPGAHQFSCRRTILGFQRLLPMRGNFLGVIIASIAVIEAEKFLHGLVFG